MDASGAKLVSVVIPNWNGRDLLAACLRSLESQTFRDFDVLVVDDGSTDDSVAMVRHEFPGVHVHALPANQGFCYAVNAGLAVVRGDLILLLNNDMTLHPDFLAHLTEAARTSSAAMFAPIIVWRDDPMTLYSAGDLQRANGRPESIGFRSPLEGFTFPAQIFGVSAGAALYRRQVFETVGLLDPWFNIYFSDSDLSFRARLAGFGAELAPEAVAYHVGSASLFGRTLKRTRQCFVNHVQLVLKNMPFPLLVRYAPAILAERAHQARRVFSEARTQSGALYAAWILGTTALSIPICVPHALAERMRIQRARRIAVRDLEALLTR